MAGPDAARPRGNGQALPPEDDENCGALLYHSVSPDDPGLKESTEQVIMKFIRSTNWCVSFGLVSLIMPVIAIPAFAQYGHPGVTIDPTPLVQAKRPRRAPVQNSPAHTTVAQKPAKPTRPAETPTEVAVNRPAPETKPQPASPANPQPKPQTNTGRKPGSEVIPTTGPGNTPTQQLSPFDALIAQAEQAEDANNPKAAADLYRRALQLKPDSGDAHWGLADALYLQHEYDVAIKEYEAAIAAGQNEAGVYNNYTNALFRSGTVTNRERSIDYYRKAIERNPASSDSYAGLSNALRVQKKLQEAKQAADKAVQLNPDSSLAHSVLGRALGDLKDFPTAIIEANKAISLAKRDAFAWVNLGGIYYLQGELMEELKAYLTARSLDPNWALPFNNVGNTFMAMRRPQEAAKFFSEAIR